MSACGRSSPARRRGSSAALSATSSSFALSSTSTSRARNRGRLHNGSPIATAEPCSRSPSDTEPGESSRAAAWRRSTSPRSAPASTQISRRATSRSTPSRRRRRRAIRTTRTTEVTTFAPASSVRSPRGSSAMIPCACYGRCASRTSWASGWTSAPSPSCELPRRSSYSPRASASSPSCGDCPRGFRRLDEVGLLEPLGGSLDERLDVLDDPDFRLVVVLGSSLSRLPISNELKRYAAALARARKPDDPSPRSIHRFRRLTEPWSIDALAYVGAPELTGVVEARGARSPRSPSSAATSSASSPGPRSDVSSTSSTRSGQWGRSRRARKHSSSHVSWPCSRRLVSVELRLALQEQRSVDLEQRLRRLLGPFSGTEAVLDAGCGTGSVAFALAPYVAEVVGIDTRVDYLEAARSAAPRTSASKRRT